MTKKLNAIPLIQQGSTRRRQRWEVELKQAIPCPLGSFQIRGGKLREAATVWLAA